MSKFFKALEQAGQELALREQARRQRTEPKEGTPPAPAASHDDQPPARIVAATERGSAAGGAQRLIRGGNGDPTPERAFQPDGGPSDGIEEHLVSLLAPASFEAQQYLTLRLMVEQGRKTANLSILAVSSPGAGDGKTTTAINLAGALAQAPEARVLLVDADLRHPSIPHHLGLDGGPLPGLVDAILDQGLSLEDVVRYCAPFNLAMVPAGQPPAASYEILKSPRLGALLEEARHRYDYILLDTPPLLPFPDCQLIAKCVDAFLIIVAAHKTPRKMVEESLNVMDPAKILGLAFNGDDRPVAGYYRAGRQPPTGQWADRLRQAVKKVSGRFGHRWSSWRRRTR